ncbi:MAG: hypothetical protein Q9217_002022 [Psora testacea]
MACVSSAESLLQEDVAFDVFATRKALKDAFDRPNKQYIEDYLDSLDPYRFTTAPIPLPLPLRSLRSAGDAETGRILGELLTFDNQTLSTQDTFLPGPVPGIQPPRFAVEHQYKSEFYGPARDTLRIRLPSYDGTQNSYWPRHVKIIQMRLKAMRLVPFVTRIPHNINNYDVEILDTERAFDPLRERLDNPDKDKIVAEVEDAYLNVYNASKSFLRTALAGILGKNFLDLSLELQKDQRGHHNQIAVVVHVLPRAKFEWYDLRKEIKSGLREPMLASMNVQTLEIEVEIIPDYRAESLRLTQETMMKSMRESFPHLLNSFGLGLSDYQGNAGSANDVLAKRRNGEVPDSAYATGPEPSPETLRFSDSLDQRGNAQGGKKDALPRRGIQSLPDLSHECNSSDNHGHLNQSSMPQSPAALISVTLGPTPQLPIAHGTRDQIPITQDSMLLLQNADQPTSQPFKSHAAAIQSSPALAPEAPPATDSSADTRQQADLVTNDVVSNWMDTVPNVKDIPPNPDSNRGSTDINPFPDPHLRESIAHADAAILQPDAIEQPARAHTFSHDIYLSRPDEPTRSTTRNELDAFGNSASRDPIAPTPNMVSGTDLVTPHDSVSQPDMSNGTVRLPEIVFLPRELAISSKMARLSGFATSNNAALQNDNGQWNLYPASLNNTPQSESTLLPRPNSAPQNENTQSASNTVLERFPMMFDFPPPAEIHLNEPSPHYQEPTPSDSRTPLRTLTPERPPGRLDWIKSVKRIPRKLRASISKGTLRDKPSGRVRF